MKFISVGNAILHAVNLNKIFSAFQTLNVSVPIVNCNIFIKFSSKSVETS